MEDLIIVDDLGSSLDLDSKTNAKDLLPISVWDGAGYQSWSSEITEQQAGQIIAHLQNVFNIDTSDNEDEYDRYERQAREERIDCC